MSGSHRATISNLPPELLFQTFLCLSDDLRLRDCLRLCRVCKSWLPDARAVLYRSVILTGNGIRNLAGTIEGNESLTPLIKHLTIYRMESLSDWTCINHILQAISKHETLLSFHLHAIQRLHLFSTEVTQLISSLSFLGHLDVDISLFMNLRAMKQFICSFPRLHTLEVNDEFSGDFEADWYDEQASGHSLDFPSTIRNLSFHLTKHRKLEALLQWLLVHTSTLPPIERFAVQIRDEHNVELLRTLLRSLGTGLTSLSLKYSWEPGQPTIDLKANTNLRYLHLSLILYLFEEYEYNENTKEQFSTTFTSLASPLLQTLDFELKLRLQTMIGYPEYDLVDWGALGDAARGAELRISINCLRKEELEGIRQRINVNRQMAWYRSQGKLQCDVTATVS